MLPRPQAAMHNKLNPYEDGLCVDSSGCPFLCMIGGLFIHMGLRSDCVPLGAEIIHYLQNECGSACSHIHVLPIYHLSLPRTHSHHGSFGSGVKDSRIDCR